MDFMVILCGFVGGFMWILWSFLYGFYGDFMWILL